MLAGGSRRGVERGVGEKVCRIGVSWGTEMSAKGFIWERN